MLHQLFEQVSAALNLRICEHAQGQKSIVQFVGIFHGRPDILGHLLDGLSVQYTEFSGRPGQSSPGLHGSSATFLQRGIVQESVCIGV